MLKGNFFRGLGYLGEGFGLIRQPGLRLFVVIPLIINILLFGLLFYFLAELFTAMIAAAMATRPFPRSSSHPALRPMLSGPGGSNPARPRNAGS